MISFGIQLRFTSLVDPRGLQTHLLVGGFNPSEKYESQLGLLYIIIPNIRKNKKCSKPPTSFDHGFKGPQLRPTGIECSSESMRSWASWWSATSTVCKPMSPMSPQRRWVPRINGSLAVSHQKYLDIYGKSMGLSENRVYLLMVFFCSSGEWWYPADRGPETTPHEDDPPRFWSSPHVDPCLMFKIPGFEKQAPCGFVWK